MLTKSAFVIMSIVSFLLNLLCLFPEPVRAQQMTGDLQFKVVDSLGSPIPGVNATITGPQIQGIRGGVSDEYGYVNVLALQPGRTSVKVSHSAYQPVRYENVLIQLGKVSFLGTVILRQTTHELPEIIISTVRTPLIDPGTAQSVGTMSAEEFERLPVDRNYRSIVSLLPLANTSYLGDEVNLGGATGMENKYFVDGVDVTESFQGYTGTDLPYNFVDEIEVKEGGYEAEYPSALGGIINVITPSGSNEFHGSATGFYTSNRMTASRQAVKNDPAREGGFSNYDVGVGVGGPLIGDQLWFYGAYNPKIEQGDVYLTGFGTYVNKITINSFAGKLTWSPSPQLKLLLMTTGDPTLLYAIGSVWVAPLNPDPLMNDEQHGGVNFSLRGTYAPEGAFLLDASVSRTTEKGVRQGATERGRNEDLFVDAGNGGVLSGGLGSFVDRYIYSDTYNINATFIAGSHILKGGARYRVANVDEDMRDKAYYRYSDTSYALEQRNAFMTVGSRMPSLYIQDTWRVSDVVQVHLGLRWDNQYIIGSDGTVGQKFLNEFQPRVGVNIKPKESLRIFASFGRYYQELSNSIGEQYSDNGGYSYSYAVYNHDPRIDSSGGTTITKIDAAVRPLGAGLKGQYYDEWKVGYERLLGENLKIGVQGVYRTLGEAVGLVLLSWTGPFAFGNPGSGALSQFPKATRDYSALVVSVQGHVGDNCNILGSYVLSRNYGNWPGLYNALNHQVEPNGRTSFFWNRNPALVTGLLPNDRTHVFKLAASFRFNFALTVGASFLWQTGTPLSEGSWGPLLLSARGSLGRTPAIWDLSFRFVYDLSLLNQWGSRLILDFLHVGSPQKPVDYDYNHFLNREWSIPNPYYGLPIRYQPAMSARLGVEMKF